MVVSGTCLKWVIDVKFGSEGALGHWLLLGWEWVLIPGIWSLSPI